MAMHEFFSRIGEMLVGRTTGPLNFRLIIQPIVAIVLAIRVALRDARAGRPPYFFWSVVTHPASRPELFRLVWQDVGKVCIAAVAIDVVYEVIVHRWVHPVIALFVGVVLAVVPYLLVRGPATRIARRLVKKPREAPALTTTQAGR